MYCDDNIFIDLSRNFTTNFLISGLSYHNAQLLKLEHVFAPTQEFASCYVRIINNVITDEFQSKLSTEIWENFVKGLTQMLYLTAF
jgi:hypothetical protein